MTHTAKLVEARDRIKALARTRRDEAKRQEQAQRAGNLPVATAEPIIMTCQSQAAGLDIAVRVIEDLLQD